MAGHVVILGNGISGITAARHVRKRSDSKITVISGETDHFFSRTALMYIYMGHMRYRDTKPYEDSFWEKNGIDLMRAWVSSIDYQNKTLKTDQGDVTYDQLILAVGSKPNKFGWPGQDLDGVQGLYSYQDLELLEENTKNGINRAVIVGGGLIGVELAEMLLTRNYPVTFLVRENVFWGNVLPKEEGDLVTRHVRKHHVDLRLSSELDEIIDDGNGRVRAVKTKDGEEIACELVGLTAGVSPNIEFLKGGDLDLNRGILVNEYLETNIPDVYAIGDCAEFHQHPTGRRNLEQVWYTGRMMGETVAQTITGNRCAYMPGNWFNSAKFFDIEYQTYGWVFADTPEGQKEFYWEHEKGEKCLKLVYEAGTYKFIGLNTFGMRLRHEMIDRWLSEGRDVQYVLEHLKDANFDPEFYATHEQEIADKFGRENNLEIKVKSKSWARILGR